MTKILVCLLFHCIFALVTRRFSDAATQSDFFKLFVLYEDAVQSEIIQTFSLFKNVLLQPYARIKKIIYIVRG